MLLGILNHMVPHLEALIYDRRTYSPVIRSPLFPVDPELFADPLRKVSHSSACSDEAVPVNLSKKGQN